MLELSRHTCACVVAAAAVLVLRERACESSCVRIGQFNPSGQLQPILFGTVSVKGVLVCDTVCPARFLNCCGQTNVVILFDFGAIEYLEFLPLLGSSPFALIQLLPFELELLDQVLSTPYSFKYSEMSLVYEAIIGHPLTCCWGH